MLIPTVNKFRLGLAIALVAAIASQARGQSPPAATARQPDVAGPEDVELTTKDFVSIHATYYPGSEGKETVPLILLHGWEGSTGPGSSRDMKALAEHLQKLGHAVITPDLRGHGESAYRQRPGQEKQLLDRDRLRAADMMLMVREDLEAVKKFLLAQHNQGRLNIELLCVVGAEMGAVVAMDWAALDWSYTPLPTMKRGQDVRAMVLVSPRQSFRGLPIAPALRSRAVRGELSALIIYGKNDRQIAREGNQIYTALKAAHRPIPEDREERMKYQDLFLFELDTSLQGTKLLTSPALNVASLISDFVQLRLVNKRGQYPWKERIIP